MTNTDDGGDAPLTPTDYEAVTFTIHDFDVMWPNAERERAFSEALEAARDWLPKYVEDDDADELVEEVFEPLWDAATEDGFSLWVHFDCEDGDAFEYPVYSRSPVGAWNSPSPTYGSTGDQPSEAFFKSVAVLFDGGEDGDNWGNVPEEIWEEMSRVEMELVHSLRDAAIQAKLSPYAALLHEYARWRVGVDEDA